jgi:hypothetical protein
MTTFAIAARYSVGRLAFVSIANSIFVDLRGVVMTVSSGRKLVACFGADGLLFIGPAPPVYWIVPDKFAQPTQASGFAAAHIASKMVASFETCGKVLYSAAIGRRGRYPIQRLPLCESSP